MRKGVVHVENVKSVILKVLEAIKTVVLEIFHSKTKMQNKNDDTASLLEAPTVHGMPRSNKSVMLLSL